MPKHARLLMLWSALALLPILNAVFIVLERGANRPFAEEWFDSALVAIATHDGTLTLQQLLTPQNDYPHFTTKLFVALHTPLTRYDLRLDMLLGVAMSAATLLIVIYLVGRQDRGMALLLAPLLSALIFTPRQAVNWMTGFQNVYFAFVLCVALIVLVIEVLPISWRALWLAALLTSFGALALGVAPFYWLSGLMALWLRGYRRWRYYAVWLALSALLTVHFLSRLATLPDSISILSRPDMFAYHALAFLGAPLAHRPQMILGIALGLFGVVLFALNALLLWRWRAEWLRAWAVLAFFSAISALITAYGRWYVFDVLSEPLLSERYVTNAVPFWIALVVISLSNLLLARQGASISWLRWGISGLNGAALLGIGALVIVSTVIAQRQYVPNYNQFVGCLRELPLTRDLKCAALYGSGPVSVLPVLVRADQLAVRRLGIFAQEPAVEPRFGALAVPLEALDKGIPLSEPPDSRFTTWQIDDEARRVFWQPPPAAHKWILWFHHITAPTYFEAEIYVLPAEAPAEEVTFRVYAQPIYGVTRLGERLLLLEERYDPRRHSQPIPVRASLAPLLNQRFYLALLLETDGAAGAQAMWIEPRLVLELTEEAARAKYYPPR